MDAVDFGIYRYLSPGGEARFWAGRRVLDPRITPREIAERVGLSESAVRARLRRLTDSGFLRDRLVVPNPGLIGATVFVADLPVRAPAEVEPVLRDLRFIGGVMFTRDVLDEDQRKIQVYLAADGPLAASRIAALVGRLTPSGSALAARPYYTPPCDLELSALLRRVLHCVRSRPDAGLAEIAATARISLKTAARCYHRLLDSRACWWTHGPESEEFPLALVRADLRRADARGEVLAGIGDEALPWMPVAADGLGLAPDRPTDLVAGLVPADAPVVLERFLRRLAAFDGVAAVHRTFALGSAPYPAWFPEPLPPRPRARV